MVQSATPLVSVIIATYNRAHLISQAIGSVHQQTLRDYEIIVVNDGSSDGTEQLLRECYGEKIVYIGKTRNAGLSAARNTGIQAARGRYVAILDDDDLWLPEKLEMQTVLIEKQPALGLVYCNSVTVNEDGEVVGETKGIKRGTVFEDLLSSNCLGPPSGVLLPKKVFAQTGYFDENLTALEDWDLWIRVAKRYPVDFVERPLVKYRVHATAMSRNIMNMQRSTFAVLDKYWPILPTEGGWGGKRNAVYSSHCINFAWKHYAAGNRDAFRDLLLKGLAYDPLHQVIRCGDDLREREQGVFEVFATFWREGTASLNTQVKRQTYASHYRQLAWEYHHRGDMGNFRRCVRAVFRWTFPRPPLRIGVPFLTSFLGKRLADALHDLRVAAQGFLPASTPAARGRAGKARKLLQRYRSLLTRGRSIRRYLAGHQVRKFHIGCGGVLLPGWLNADLGPADGSLCIDARETMPFDDCTFDYLFSEHLIEHLDYGEGVSFLEECFRIIKPYGTIRIATPDLGFLLELSNAEKTELQERYITWAVASFLPVSTAAQDSRVINNFFHNWGHKFIYDFKTLKDTLEGAGFVSVKRCPVGISDHAELNDVESHGRVIPEEFNRLETMVLEGQKPDCA